MTVACPIGLARAQEPVVRANYKQAKKFSSEFLRKFTYDSRVTANWIEGTESFWYRYRNSEGRRYWLVDPVAKTKVELFDHDHLAALLSEACEKAIDAEALDLRSVRLDKGLDEMKFAVDGWSFVYRRTTEELEKKEKAKPSSSRSTRGRSSRRRGSLGGAGGKKKTEAQKKKEAKQREERLMASWRKALEEHEKKAKKAAAKEQSDKQAEQSAKSSERPTQNRGLRSSFSPDLELYVMARQGNLYVVERDGELQELSKVEEPADAVKSKAEAKAAAASRDGKVVDGDLKKGKSEEDGATDGEAGDNGKAQPAPVAKAGKKEKLRFPFEAKAAKQLSSDGEKDYSYGGSLEEDYAVPASVTWSPDASAFYVTRRDSRGVAELFLVDSLAEPRPKLEQYKYPMPGEDKVRHSELMLFDRGTGKMIPMKPKWKDESYIDVRWLPNGELRVMRRDRLLRNLEYGIVDPATGEMQVLFSESRKDAGITTQSIRYLDERGEFIWWSERSGWGHYYLYGLDGKLKNAITRGRFRASQILDVDEEKGLMWFRGNGREKGENVYYEHLYRVRLDGGDLTLLDEGDATHRSQLSKTKNYVVDNHSRVDMAPASVLRDRNGKLLMELERSDTAQLEAMGWQPPERFTVKAADGVTDLYGNMWKPFDFDENKKYPLIVHVYPGPQTEGVTHTFSATGSRQELAQVGFVVIQVGHRGGTPTRSKAYGSYGYYNMRDYPLEDKKAAIEQLAARHDYIDIDRIGIYGHSGGGFMTAAALLRPPYNRFFKVGVSTAGNHDNNIYNNYWGERYHGLKQAKKKAAKTDSKNDAKTRSGSKATKSVERGKDKDRDGKRTQTTDQGRGTQGKATKSEGQQKDQQGKSGSDQKSDKRKESEDTKFEIKIATNAELAENLEGKLLLIHGEIDNNVHPAGTMRLVNALIRANKRFDMLIIPGARHSFGRASTYAKHRTWEYFAEHLLGDRQPSANIMEKGR